MNAVKNSTATGTTATADTAARCAAAAARCAAVARYCGRFAPSPTGQLHHGSLVAALASWLDARSHAGKWLVRMEDLDVARTVPKAEDTILRTLDDLGLQPDEPPVRQSERASFYLDALEQLRRDGHAFRCTCSRSEGAGSCSGGCRSHPPPPGPAAWRFALAPGDQIDFMDAIQGPCRFKAEALGDPVIFRRDGIAAYQLAVVVDDAAQGVTNVVRGSDLLDSTAWQLRIGAALGLPQPQFAHVPLITEPDGSKLAKSRRSPAIAESAPGQNLAMAMVLLGYNLPDGLSFEPVPRILDWAVAGWPPQALKGRSTVAIPT